jgi:hypothetical protein
MRQNTTKRNLSESLSVRSSHTTELLQCLRDYRLKAEFTLVRVADTPGCRKQVLPLIGLLAITPLYPLRVATQTG